MLLLAIQESGTLQACSGDSFSLPLPEAGEGGETIKAILAYNSLDIPRTSNAGDSGILPTLRAAAQALEKASTAHDLSLLQLSSTLSRLPQAGTRRVGPKKKAKLALRVASLAEYSRRIQIANLGGSTT